MLGAQARAAELQAAKSAAMRQKAHRDAQDQAIPPQSTPVSLTDFARNPLLSKNKGAKAFRPLVDSDFEASTFAIDHQMPISSSPTTDEAEAAFLESIPTAPRAMISHSQSFLSKMTPSRATAPSFTPQNTRQGISYRSSDAYDGIVSTPPYLSTTTNTIGHVFGPNDLSPTKQEIKLSELRQEYSTVYNTLSDPYTIPTSFVTEAGTFTPQESFSCETSHPYHSVHTQFSYEPYLTGCSDMHRYHPITGDILPGYGSACGQAERTQSFTNDLVDHHNKLQTDFHHRETYKTIPATLTDEQPYDRNMRMQSFVAAQQAIARTGKTVLHNPYLHKSSQLLGKTGASQQENAPATTSTTESPFQTHVGRSKSNVGTEIIRSIPRKSMRLEDKEAILRAILKRTAARAKLALETVPNLEKNSTGLMVAEPSADPSEQQQFDEFTFDHQYILRISTRDKEAMLRKIKRIAAEPSIETDSKSMSQSISVVGADAQHWLRTASIHSSERRTAVNAIVDEHEKRKDYLSNYGIIGKPVFRERSDLSSRGALRAVANIMATIHDRTGNSESCLKDNKHASMSRYTIDESTAIGLDG